MSVAHDAENLRLALGWGTLSAEEIASALASVRRIEAACRKAGE